MGNNRTRKASAEVTTAEPLTPIAPSGVAMPGLNLETGGALAARTGNGNGAIAPGQTQQHERGTGRDEEPSNEQLSQMTTELLERANRLASTINATASGRLGAAEEFILELTSGTATIDSLVARYGLTDDVTAQRELLKLKQLSNSIEMSIAGKQVHLLALQDQTKTLQISEEEARLAGQVWDTTDAIDKTRHKSVMTPLQMHIRAAQERAKKAQLVTELHTADKKETKAQGILGAMKATAQKFSEQPQSDRAATPAAPVQPTR